MTTKSESFVDLRSLETVTEFNSHLMCLVCHCPFIRPVRLRCDHIFCQSCLNDFIRSSDSYVSPSSPDFLCPTCRTPAKATLKRVPRLITAMCDDILVKCPFRDEGCEEIVQRGHIQAHVDKYCDYKLMRCPGENCKEKIRKKDMDPDEKCLHQERECKECGESVIELDFNKHQTESCPSLKVTCSDCDASIKRTDLTEHIENCPEAKRDCKASPYGCRVKLGKAEVEEHEKSCPLAALGPYLETQSFRMASMETTIKQLQQRNELLEEEVGNIRSTLSRSSSPASTAPITLDDSPPLSIATLPDEAPSQTEPSSSNVSNTTTYLLSIHESLRDEVSQLSAALADLDARANMSMMNENLRIREDMAHITAGLNTVRMQVHMLMNSRLQQGQRAVNTQAGQAPSSLNMPGPSTRITTDSNSAPQGSRRLSDSGGTKL